MSLNTCPLSQRKIDLSILRIYSALKALIKRSTINSRVFLRVVHLGMKGTVVSPRYTIPQRGHPEARTYSPGKTSLCEGKCQAGIG